MVSVEENEKKKTIDYLYLKTNNYCESECYIFLNLLLCTDEYCSSVQLLHKSHTTLTIGNVRSGMQYIGIRID
jgi:hypothetical protein